MAVKKYYAIIAAIAASSAAPGLDMQVVAHRGLPDTYVENTAESIGKAYELGATWVETDFHHTKAGQMVCIHCSKVLKELSGVDKKISDLTPEDVANINIGKRDGKNRRIPLMPEIFKLVPKNAVLQAEIKGYSPQYADIFVREMKAAGLKPSNFLISSFQDTPLKDFKKKYPQFDTMWLVPHDKYKIDELLAKARDINVKYIALGGRGAEKIDPAYAQAIRDAGFDFRMWGVHTPAALKAAAALGATGFTTNHYKKMLTVSIKGVRLLP
ncbi:MAG: hypothetical protein IJI37_07105 [Opitutales bacterium]|nr:hypothetical protein [Opitutales bacterium]